MKGPTRQRLSGLAIGVLLTAVGLYKGTHNITDTLTSLGLIWTFLGVIFSFLLGRESGGSDQKLARRLRGLRQARALLNLACFVLPRKITDECIGDAVEEIERAAKEGVHPWKLQAMALIRVGWALFFTLHELTKSGTWLAALLRLLSGSLW